MPEPSTAVVVPVKDFARAKLRLAPTLDPEARFELARAMATTVVEAAGHLPVHVVCDHDDVAAWAASVGAGVLWTPGLGLNGAVQAGVDELAGRGVDHVIVAHSDLPLATDLAWVVAPGVVTVVPDRRLDGTNVLAVPTGTGFRFAYGPGSFRAHCDEAGRLDLVLRIVQDPRLGWDVDLPADLSRLVLP